MPKFKKGDRVVSVKTGAKGVVDEVYGEEKYAVLFDGAANPDRVEGHQIRLANSRACNGKFKVGDKVWVPAKQKRGVIRGVSATGNQYDVEFMGGGGAYVNEEGLEFLQALGNSDAPVSTNSVVRNAMAANRRVATNREIPAQTAIDYFKKLIAEMESLDKKIRPMVTRFKTLVADGNTSSMDFPDRKIVGKPEELRALDKLKDRFEELRDFAKMTMGI